MTCESTKNVIRIGCQHCYNETTPFCHNGWREGRKEMFLFNDALITFYLRLYGVGWLEGGLFESKCWFVYRYYVHG